MKYYIQAINNGVHYKKDKLEFDYLKPKKIKELKEKNTNIKIIGSIKLKETNKNNVDTLIIQSNNCTFTFEIENEIATKNVLGYVLVSDNTYIAITKNNILLPIVVVGLIIIGSLVYVNQRNNIVEISNNLEFEEGSDWDGNMPSNGEQSKANSESIEIPGYAELYVSSENPEIQLINPENNTVYFIYTIKENNKIIYETKAIEPNKMISLNLKEILEVGEHNLSFVISTYDIETQAPCNGATQDVKVTVKN